LIHSPSIVSVIANGVASQRRREGRSVMSLRNGKRIGYSISTGIVNFHLVQDDVLDNVPRMNLMKICPMIVSWRGCTLGRIHCGVEMLILGHVSRWQQPLMKCKLASGAIPYVHLASISIAVYPKCTKMMALITSERCVAQLCFSTASVLQADSYYSGADRNSTTAVYVRNGGWRVSVGLSCEAYLV
jgi:hypothetical protein